MIFNVSTFIIEIREIKEELETDIEVGELIDTIEYDYPTFHLSMDCFWAKVVSGKLFLKEASESKWLRREELYSVDCLPADITLIEKINRARLNDYSVYAIHNKEKYGQEIFFIGRQQPAYLIIKGG